METYKLNVKLSHPDWPCKLQVSDQQTSAGPSNPAAQRIRVVCSALLGSYFMPLNSLKEGIRNPRNAP